MRSHSKARRWPPQLGQMRLPQTTIMYISPGTKKNNSKIIAISWPLLVESMVFVGPVYPQSKHLLVFFLILCSRIFWAIGVDFIFLRMKYAIPQRRNKDQPLININHIIGLAEKKGNRTTIKYHIERIKRKVFIFIFPLGLLILPASQDIILEVKIGTKISINPLFGDSISCYSSIDTKWFSPRSNYPIFMHPYENFALKYCLFNILGEIGMLADIVFTALVCPFWSLIEIIVVNIRSTTVRRKIINFPCQGAFYSSVKTSVKNKRNEYENKKSLHFLCILGLLKGGVKWQELN